MLSAFGAGALGLTALWFGVATGAASGKTAQHAATKVTVITVTAGKPTELGFKLSKYSNLKPGTYSFKVTNRGVVSHDFKICTTTVATFAKNSCTGKVTKMLKTGQSATLTVTLKKSGKYEYLCTVPGHAGAGMKGLLGIGVKLTAAQATAAKPTGGTGSPSPNPGTTTTVPSPGGGGGGGSNGGTCASPKTTTVNVSEFEYGFTISPNPIPCGTVTFNMTNTGNVQHDFVIEGLAAGAGHGTQLNGGQSASMTITLGPGSFSYECDIADHAELGMQGAFTVQ